MVNDGDQTAMAIHSNIFHTSLMEIGIKKGLI
jgi:hypothetical protein